MSLELIKEAIEFDQPVRKETVQVIVEEDLIVPDIKPDMAKVLQIDGKVDIEQVEISADRLNYKGHIKALLLYAAEGSDRLVHSMVGNLPLDDFIHMDGIKKEMSYNLEYDLEHLEFTWINSRKLNVKAIVSMSAKVSEKRKNEIIVDAKSPLPIQLQMQPFSFYRTAANNQDKMVIKDELAVPSGKPNIQEILKSDIRISNKESSVGDGIVTVKGNLDIRTLYAGAMGESEMDYMEHQIPFNGSIECPGTEEGMHCNTDIKMTKQYIQIRPDLDGEERILDVEVVLLVNIKVISMEEIQIIEDAYCPGKEIKLNKVKLPYQKMINKNKESILLKEVMSLDSEAPDIYYIYNLQAKPKIEEIRLMDDKMMVEGIAEIKLIYITNNTENPIYEYDTIMPFKQSIDVKGATIDKKVDLKVDIDDIICNPSSNRDFEVKMMLQVDMEVMDEQEIDILMDMIETEIDPNVLKNMPSLIIYMVQSGDTLWKIAKKYNATIEELTTINDIESPEKVYPGQKLLIIKKVVTV
jgi:LysM repeat protein